MCLLWSRLWSPCRSLSLGCRGLPYALVEVQGHAHQRAFSGYHMDFSDALSPLQLDPISRTLTND